MAKKKNELKETGEEIMSTTPVTETEMKNEVKEPEATQEKSVETMTIQELKAYHESKLAEYKERIDKIMDEEELRKEEQEIVDLYQKHDDVIKDRQYELPEAVTFNGSKYSQKDVARLICKFVNKMEVDYRTTLGMWQLYKFWLNPTKTIGYGAYDSTLRILGQTKFKGFSEWQDIMIIVEYFKKCNESYAKDASQYDFLAEWHNMIMSRMELVSGHTPEADALEGVQTPQ